MLTWRCKKWKRFPPFVYCCGFLPPPSHSPVSAARPQTQTCFVLVCIAVLSFIVEGTCLK